MRDRRHADERRAIVVIIGLLTFILVMLAIFGGPRPDMPKRECIAIGNAMPIGCKPKEDAR